MIYTTYFAKLKKLPKNVIPISICAKAPSWYSGAEYKQLAPTYELLMRWRETHDKDYYTKCFTSEILGRKDVTNVIRELQTLLPFEVIEVINSPICFSKDYHIVLVCYEKSSDFCHRHLVSEWFQEKGIKCSEYDFNER